MVVTAPAHKSTVLPWIVIPILLLVGLAIGIYFGIDYYRSYNSTDHLEGLGRDLNAEPINTENDLLPLEPGR